MVKSARIEIAGVALALVLGASGHAYAQAVPVFQSGLSQPNDIGKYVRNGMIRDAGTIDGDNNGMGVNPFAVTDFGQRGFCSNSAPTDGPYQKLCFGHAADGSGRIEASNEGGAPAKPMQFCYNGNCVEFPFTGGSVFGPVPAPAASYLTKWAGGGTLDTAFNSSVGGNLIGNFLDTTPPGQWGPHRLHVGSVGPLNNAIFSTDMNAAPSTYAFPTAVTGYARLESGSNGNAVFGVYGRAELYANTGTVVAAEFTASNRAGPTGIDTGLPPDGSIPNATKNAKGVNITCAAGTVYDTNDCSVGLHVSNENGVASAPVFNTGLYLQFYRQYGLYIDAMPTGIQTSEVIQNNGGGINLQLGTTGAEEPLNAVISVVNSLSGTNNYTVRQNGDIDTAGKLEFTQPARPTAASCGSSASVNRSNDQAGIITVGSGTVTSCEVDFVGSFRATPSCTISGESGMTPLWILAATAPTKLVVGPQDGSSNMAGFNFTYHCLDQP